MWRMIQMQGLERQAIEKEQEKDMWKQSMIDLFRNNRLSERQLSLGIEKIFQLGHSAGHCRGESYLMEMERYVRL